jgi:dienelactone hydrolase
MAANFAANPSNGVEGLVLWASYPPNNTDLSKLPVSVASLFGSEDGLLSAEEIENSAVLLPATTEWSQINGGNHAQFGWYGEQPGDNPATISREEQQVQAIQGTISVLEKIQE